MSNKQPRLKGVADLSDLNEDARIDLIGHYASTGKVAGFIVETHDKADRYMRKLVARYPVRELDRHTGPVIFDAVFVRVVQRE